MVKPLLAWFDGPCPSLVCRSYDAHGHLACPECGTVQFRNRECSVCWAAWGNAEPDPDIERIVSVKSLRHLYRSVTCPDCGAMPGQLCRGWAGQARWEHSGRSRRAILTRRAVGVMQRG